MRKYVIMGVQGSGKGTQSAMLSEDLDLVHIGVGDIFRWNVQHHTKLGAQVRRTMAAGELVSDDVVEGVVSRPAGRARLELRLHHRRVPAQRAPGRVLPGELRHRRGHPPRPARQRGPAPGAGPAAVRGLRPGLQPDRQQPARSDGKCDACGGELVQREDDTEEALAVRLREYHSKTDPVLEIFRRKEYVVTVDTRPDKEDVQQEIRTAPGPAALRAAAQERALSRCGSWSRPTRSRARIGAADAAAALAAGWRAARPGDEVTCVPLADGGEGTAGGAGRRRAPAARWHEAPGQRARRRAGHRALAGAARPACTSSSWPARPGCRCWPRPTRSARTPRASAS